MVAEERRRKKKMMMRFYVLGRLLDSVWFVPTVDSFRKVK